MFTTASYASYVVVLAVKAVVLYLPPSPVGCACHPLELVDRMAILSRVIVFTSCATTFVGTAYVAGLALSPPPSYAVSDRQRIERYNVLSIESAYDKKTRSQEFLLGISRLRRRLLWDEGLLRGRVLEVGAGCGGVLSYYDAVVSSASDPPTVNGSTEEDHAAIKQNTVTEVVLCDRSPGMIQSTAEQVYRRYGYQPYRYPDYDLVEMQVDTRTSVDECKENTSTSEMPGRRSVMEGPPVETQQLRECGTGVTEATLAKGCLTAEYGNGAQGTKELVPPILSSAFSGTTLPLLSESGLTELKKRESEGEKRILHDGSAAKNQTFSVANYAAEQMPFSDNSFDTVVDMFGLCSYDDPVRALREMSRVCKPDGHLLLLEHGKGHWSRVNNYLDKWAPRHAKMWGCWWNRDIQRYLRLAGITIIKKDERHFGTTHYIVARPFKMMDELEDYRSSLSEL